jgi:hypothetical protein
LAGERQPKARALEAAGFQRVIETSARSAGLARWLVRLEL